MKKEQKENNLIIAQEEIDRLFAGIKPPADNNTTVTSKNSKEKTQAKIQKMKEMAEKSVNSSLKENSKKSGPKTKNEQEEKLSIYLDGKCIGKGVLDTRNGKKIIRAVKITLLIISYFVFAVGCVSTPKNQSSIQTMIRQGKIDEAKSFFLNKADINNQDEDGNTALHIASAINDADLVQFLLIKGANPELKNFESKTPLHIAIESYATDAIPVLLANGADVFALDQNGNTALTNGLEKGEIYYDLLITQDTSRQRDHNGKSIVHYLVADKNDKGVDFAIRNKLDIDVKDNNGKTPLALALDNAKEIESVKIAASLLEAGASSVGGVTEYFENAVLGRNYSLRLEYGQTPLHIAAINNHKGIAQFLVSNGANLALQDISGATPLHEACRYGNTDIARLFLQNKADVNCQDTLCKTPVELIIPEKSRTEIYKLLIEYNADLNHKDMYGDTVLHTAAMINLNTDLLELLVTNGADVNIRNRKGNTALSTAVEHKLKEQITFFVNHGADIHAEDSNHKTPLIRVLTGKDGLFESMVTKMNVNSVDSTGNTPLLIAIAHNADISKIQYIIGLGANVNTRNRDGNSALFYAVSTNNRKVGELLLEKGGNFFAANTKDVSPLLLAFTKKTESLDWLINSKTISATDGSGNTALHYACDWNIESAADYLIQRGAVIDALNANGQTPLFNAAKSDNIGVLETLVKAGANLKHRDALGSTALHTAVRWNSLETTNRLIELGLSPDTQNIAGKTPLAEAAVEGNNECAVLLLSKGANPNVYDTSGRTSLSDAVRASRPEMVTLLLKYGANPQIQDLNGRNPFHEAAETGNIEIITILSKANGNPLARDKEDKSPLSISFKQDLKVTYAVLGTNKTITDSEGNTPVHLAVTNKVKASTLLSLIKKGYPFDTRNSKGFTPLAIAVNSNEPDSINILLEHGANPFNEINAKGENVLSLAFKNNNSEILSYIVKYCENKTDIKGNTILHYAAKYADAGTVKRLLAFGLNKKTKNYSGETAYDIAVNWKHPDIAALLKI